MFDLVSATIVPMVFFLSGDCLDGKIIIFNDHIEVTATGKCSAENSTPGEVSLTLSPPLDEISVPQYKPVLAGGQWEVSFWLDRSATMKKQAEDEQHEHPFVDAHGRPVPPLQFADFDY